MHEELGLADLSRTDLIVDADGEVHFLEVNVSPGLTETSMFPMAVEAAGHRLGDVLARLLRQAAARAELRPTASADGTASSVRDAIAVSSAAGSVR